MRSIDASSLWPGPSPAGSVNPARRQTSSCISRMNVLAWSLYG